MKIRGFRVELGEIESVLSQHPGIRECSVTINSDKNGQKRLVAYFVAAHEPAPNASDFRKFLGEKLPYYMAPSVFVRIPQLPLTPNGKVDRKALPEPAEVRPELEEKYAASRDDVEVKLTGIWEKVLGVHPIGIEDKFFDLGGHSLLAVKLIAHISNSFEKDLPLAAIFQAPTVAQMAALLREEKDELSDGTSSIVEIQARGTRPPLFLVHGAGGGMFWGYVNLARHLGNEQPVYGFRSRGLDGKAEFESLEAMAAKYVADMRVIQPNGPYHLGGYCFGGNVAYEMARQLSASGEKVELLALINCAPPNSSYSRLRYTPKWFIRFLRNLLYWSRYSAQWTRQQRREFLRWKLQMACKNLKALIRLNIANSNRLDVENMVDLSSFSPEQQRLWESHIRAQFNYRPQPFPGRVHLFRSPGHPVWCSFDPHYGWTELAQGGVEVFMVEAGHEKILEEPFVEVVADGLNKLLKSSSHRTKADFAKPQVLESVEEKWSRHLAFWKRQLAGAPELVEFPSDFSRPASQTCRAASEKLILDPELCQRLTESLEQLGVDRFVFFVTALASLLKRYIRQEECILSTPVELRPDFQSREGSAQNLLLLRTDFSGDPTFVDLLARVQKTFAEAMAHKEIPFEILIKELCPARDKSYHPLTQILFDYRSGKEASDTFNADRTEFDLCFHVIEEGERLVLHVDYATDLFAAPSMGRLLKHWRRLLEGIAEKPKNRLSQLPMLTAEELALLDEWNSTRLDYPEEKSLVDLFADQAARTPDAIALVSGETRLSFKELRSRAGVVARKLAEEGVGNETLVGICVERSWEMIAGIIGALQAGAAYVPMDPAYPQERLEFMARDAQLRVILTQKKLLASLPLTDARAICMEDLDWDTPASLEQRNARPPRGSDLAYVIYTSGSTGQPKGVAIEHRNAVAFVYWARSVFDVEELDGVLASTSICFDLSIFEMFVPLSWGGKVILSENALALPHLPAMNEVRLINTVPSAIRELLRAKAVPPSVRVVNLAGEPLPTPLVDQIYAESCVQKVFDLYGPTETTTYSTFTLRKAGEPATIGRPLANEQVYLLDKHRQLVPIGVPGELYIGGAGLARGYLRRPELTGERFVTNPFRAGGRLYKTGDLARWRSDGNLEFLGRIDHQVKIRGFRIELGEVESALKKQNRVREAVVIAREDAAGGKRLVAYVVIEPNQRDRAKIDPGSTVLIDELRRGLRQHLPEYMLPSVFLFLDALPLTPNGKVDRKALPMPEVQRNGSVTEEAITPVQEQIAAIWRDIFQLPRVGIHDNFFDLGGHSLLAFQMISRLRPAFKVEMRLSDLFEAPTIAALAEALSSGRWQSHDVSASSPRPMPRSGAIPSSFVQDRLWLLDQLNPNSAAYNVPLALRLKGPLNIGALQKALDHVVSRHEALRTVFRYENGVVTQVIAPMRATIRLVEKSRTCSDDESWLQELLNSDAQVPFDLSTGPLIRVTLTRMSETDHALLVVMHHTISDGWSIAVFFQELEAFYRAFCFGTQMPTLPALPIQYADFAQWQRSWMQGRFLEQEIDYWKNALKDAPPRIDLPIDKAEPAVPSRRASRHSIELGRDLSDRINAISHTAATTPFMFLLTALGVTLQKWTGQKDMVIGTVVAGRLHKEVENMIGCFMNFLPIRIHCRDEETGEGMLSQIRKTVLEAQNHQDCPFEKIVEAINPERKSNQNPLYNVGLLLQNFPSRIFDPDEIESAVVPINLQAALLDLRFEVEKTSRGFSVSCEFKTELFNHETIDELLNSLRQILEALTSAPTTRLAEVRESSALQRQASRSVNRGLRQTIAVAATFTAEPLEESVSFWSKELALPLRVEFAPYNQVFQQLLDPTSLLSGNKYGLNVLLLRLEDWQNLKSKEASSGPADLDNVDRSANELVTALKSAAIRWSVPCLVCICPPSIKIEADSAEQKQFVRIERMLSAQLESVPGVHLVRSEDLWKWYPVADYYDSTGDELGRVPYTPIFYTALGTLLVRKLHAMNRPPYKVIALDCDQTLWSGVCGEDGPDGIKLDHPRIALQQFMRAQLDAGALLCLCSKNNEEDVLQVFSNRKEMPLRYDNFATSRLNWNSKAENLKSLARELNLGLDSFIFVDDNPVECAAVQDQCPEVLTLLLPENVDQIPQFLNHCWAFDRLKTTSEDHGRSEMYQQNRQRQQFLEKSVSLKEFLNGLALKIQIAPVAPDQLTRAAQLTQRTNQFNFSTVRRTEGELQTLTRTAQILTVNVSDRFGDYGLVGVVIYRLQTDALEVDTFLISCRVLGRGVEHQMLSRLGELAREQKLAWVDVHFTKSSKNKPALDFLEKVGSLFRQALNGGYIYRFPAEIAAKVHLDASSAESIVTAETEILSREPDNSAASPRLERFNRYRELALTSCDVATIHKSMELKAARSAGRASGYVPPRNPLERQLCEIWQRLLRVERVGIRENFFELGGHSLLAVRLFAEVEKLTARKLPLVTLFQAPTVEQLAEILSGNEAEGKPRSLLVEIQPRGDKPPLFLVHGAGGDVLWGYANLAAHFPPDQPVYGIKSRGQEGLEEWKTLEEMAAAYLQEVRSLQPEGPYNLGGYCFGGNVAYEMARRLRAEGQTIGLLALLDSAPANAGYEKITWWKPQYAYRFAKNLYYWWTDFAKLDSRTRIKFIARKSRALCRKWLQRLLPGKARDSFDIEDVIDPTLFPTHEINLWKSHLRALTEHVTQPYSGQAVLFRTRGQPLFSSLEEDFCWGGLIKGGVEVISVPGSHESIFVEPNVQHLAKELTSALSNSQQPVTGSARPTSRSAATAVTLSAKEQPVLHHDPH